ncbi:MAG TPA: branched-chain amino acid ABC transporter substrate-binding protein [Aeromicrobium sp.]|nr:branched-chain amino acid ABC transporter substrate-binding protein [Aeromicrobium sp.]
MSAAGALALAGCSSSGNDNPSGGETTSNGGGLGGGSTASGGNQTYSLGFIGALSGANAQLGINERNGAQLAIDQANASGEYDFTVKLVPSDSQGDPTKAPAAATTLIQNPDIIGIIGPAFSGESLAVNAKFCDASPSIPIVTASASNGTLQQQGWKCWHRIVPNDNVEGSQGADWLARAGVKKLYVLNDLSAYGKGVADTVAKEAKAKGLQVVTNGVDGTSTNNYNPVAQQIKASGADALFYGGYDAQAALLAKALVAVGFDGTTVGGNGIKSSAFTEDAGPAGDGWYMTCGCQDATTAESAQTFAADYKAAYNTDPSTYSPEAFDAANLFMDAIAKAEASGPVTRTSLMDALNAEDFTGITTQIKFAANGELQASSLTVNLYRQEDGVIKSLGNINDLDSK